MYVLTGSFCQDPLESWFGRQRSLGLRKDNPSMGDFGYSNNAISNQKHLKSITNSNVADGGMTALTNVQLTSRKPKKEWTLKRRS